MIKLRIIDIQNYTYILENNNKIYNLDLGFYGEKQPKVNDIIYIPNKILQEQNTYFFGPIKSKYSKNIDINENELIKVVTTIEEYYLQRYYG